MSEWLGEVNENAGVVQYTRKSYKPFVLNLRFYFRERNSWGNTYAFQFERDIFYSIQRPMDNWEKWQYPMMLSRVIHVNPNGLMKYHNKLVFDHYFSKIPFADDDFINKYLRGSKGRINWRLLKLTIRNKEIVQQALADNQHNIIPFLIETGQSPQELKEIYGKNTWKKICRNTLSRNKLISQRNRFDGLVFPQTILESNNKLKVLVDTPTTLLKDSIYRSDDVCWVMKNYPNFKLKNFKDFYSEERKLLNYYRDTQRMLGDRFNPNWGYARLIEEHDREAVRQNRATTLQRELQNKEREKEIELISKPYSWMLDYPEVLSLSDGAYTAKLLTTSQDLQDEGNAMHHCVGGFSFRLNCAKQRYMVYAISRNGVKYSTLGIRLAGTINCIIDQKNCAKTARVYCWEIDQHYKKSDHAVDRNDAKDFAQTILKAVNKHVKLKQTEVESGKYSEAELYAAAV